MAERNKSTSVSKQKLGIEDIGMEYQYNVITYMAASLSENPTVENFITVSNLSKIPSFDDLIFKVWYKGQSHPRVYLGQVKHRKSKIRLDSEKHRLADYKRDMMKIINNKENIALLQDVPTENIEFLFYSNNILMKSKCVAIHKQVPRAPVLCNIELDESYRAKFPINISRNCYRFSAVNYFDDEDSLFMDRTRLLLNQSNNKKIIFDIMNLYKEEFSKDMAFAIARYVREYFRIPTVTNITKDIFETELLRIRLSKYIISPTKAVQMNPEQTRIWNDITLDYDVTMVDARTDVKDILCGCFLQKINDLYSCDFKWNECVNKNRKLTSDFDRQPFVDRSKLKGLRYWLIPPDTIDLLLEEMWKYADIPVMLKMDGEISLLARYRHLGKKFILICDVAKKYDEMKALGLRILADVADIEDKEERACFLRNIAVSLQGREPVHLEEIIGQDQNCMKSLTCSEILHLIKSRKAFLEEGSLEKVELTIIIRDIANEKVEKCEVFPVYDSKHKNILLSCHRANVSDYMESMMKNTKFQNYSICHVRESEYGLEFISGDKTKLKAFLVDEDGNHVFSSTCDECVPVIGSILGSYQHAYIYRTLHKPVIHRSIFRSKPRVYLLCGDLKYVDDDIEMKLTEASDSLINDSKVVNESIFLKTSEDNALKGFSFGTKNPVLLLKVTERNLILLGYKNCDDLTSFISYSEDTISENMFFNAFSEHKITVINGEAGMGKTALLHSLSQAYDEKYCVLFCDLSTYSYHLKDAVKVNSILDSVFTKCTQTKSWHHSLLSAIYEYHRCIGKVILFIDSFDEVLPVYEEVVLDFIKAIANTPIKIVIASRTIAKKLLINQMEVYPLAIDNLKVENLSEYLKCRNLTDCGVEEMPKEFLANPLFLKFLFFLSEKRTLDFANFDVVDLYNEVILEKIKRYHEKVGMHYDPKIEYLNEEVLEIHRLVALAAIFGKEWLIKHRIVRNYKKLVDQLNSQKIKLGIVKEFRDDFPVFMNISFAEFLVAQWLSINLFDEENAADIYAKMLTECDRNVHYFFDSMVCKDLKLHMAVIKGNFALMQEMCKRDEVPLDNLDKCGRSCLHLASHYCLNEQNYNMMEILMNHMLRKNCDFQTRDTYMKWNWFEYLKFKNPEYFERACSFGSTTALKVFLKFQKKVISNIHISNALLNSHFQTLLFLFHMNTSLLPNNFNRAFNIVINNGCMTAACDLIEMNFGRDPRLIIFLKVCQNFSAQSSMKNAEYLAEMRANRFSALHIASMYGNVELVKKLLRLGIRGPMLDDFGRTAFHYAIIQGSDEIISLMLATKCLYLYFQDESKYTALHFAVKFSNPRVVQLLLDSGGHLYDTSASYDTLLHIATKRGSVDICKALLEYGMYVDEKNTNTSSALLLAAEIGNLNIVHLLLNYGADIRQIDAWGNTALHLACFQGHQHIIRYLISKSHNITSFTNESGLTPIEILIMSGKSNLVEIFRRSAEISDTNDEDKVLEEEETLETHDEGYNPLHFSRSAKKVDLFLSNHGNINKLNEKAHDDQTPLHTACKNGYFDVVVALLSANADALIQDRLGQTPLYLAVQNGNINIVNLLVIHGTNITNNAMESALWTAVKNCNADIVRLLLENDADVHRRDYDGKSVLHIAAKSEETDIPEILLRHGANVNETDYCEMTPLDVAVEYQNVKIVLLLLENGANINHADNRGRTALHIAVENQNTGIVRLLLKHGADVSHQNDENKAAVHIALKKENTIIQKMLLESHIMAKNFNNCKDACLRIAVSHGDLDVAKMILEEEADINYVNEHNESLLHVAVDNQNEELVDILLQKGINCNLLDSSGRAAIHIAVENGNMNIVKCLLQHNKDIFDFSKLSPLQTAVENENIEMVKFLLKLDANTNFTSLSKGSALHVATERENMDIVNILLETGIDPNLMDSAKGAALHIAAEKENIHIAKVLLKAGANVNLTDSFERSPLHIAIEKTNMDMMKILLEIGMGFPIRSTLGTLDEMECIELASALLERGVDDSIANYFRTYALHTAVKNNNIHILEVLLEMGVDINLMDSNDRSVLHVAFEKDNIDMIEFIMEKGIDINHVDSSKRSALHCAVDMGNVHITKSLLRKGIDIRDSQEQCLLHTACMQGNLNMVRLLIENGFSVNVTESFQRSALHIAIEYKNIGIAPLLIQMGVDINAKNIFDESALHIAVETDQLDFVRLLLENGVDIEARTKYENSPLHIAAICKHVDMVRLLLRKTADINLLNSFQQSSLHYSVMKYQLIKPVERRREFMPIKTSSATDVINCIEMLLRNGIDINHVDNRRQSALHIAAEFHTGDIVREFLDNGADVNIADNRGNNILHIVSRHQNSQIIRNVIQKVRCLDAVNYTGHTALHIAVRYGDANVVKALLENGADINKTTRWKQSPLHLAVKYDKFDVVNVLLQLGADVHYVDHNRRSILHLALEGQNVELIKVILEAGIDIDMMDLNNTTALDIAHEIGNVDIINVISEYKNKQYAERLAT